MKTILSILVIIAVVVGGATADGQQPNKVPRIGVISGGSASTDAAYHEAFLQGLGELGHIKGTNILIEYRYAEGNRDRLAGFAAELVRLRVDVIVAAGATGVRETKKVTKTIPIVMSNVSDPVTLGFVASLAKPGGNVTGLSTQAPELGGKRLELLKQTVPKLDDVAVLYDPRNPGMALEVKEVVPGAARGLGLSMRSLELRDAHDFENMFAALNKDRPDGLYASGAGSFMRVNRKRLAELVLKSRFPSVHDNVESVDAGGLLYNGADVLDAYRRVAVYVDKFSGASTLPNCPSSGRRSLSWSSI